MKKEAESKLMTLTKVELRTQKRNQTTQSIYYALNEQLSAFKTGLDIRYIAKAVWLSPLGV